MLSIVALLWCADAQAAPDGDFIRTWLICGPFPNPPNKAAVPGEEHIYDHTPPCVGLDTDYLVEHGGEAKIVPHAGLVHAKKDGTDVTWFGHTSPDDKIVFRKLITRSPNVVAYAFTTIDMDEGGRYLLALGSDEGVRVWVNGEHVHHNLVKRSIRVDDDLIPVSLKKGENRVLVKVEQGWGGWGFMLRVVPRDEVFAAVETDVTRLEVEVSLRRLSTDKRQHVSLLSGGKTLGTGFLEDVSGSGVASGAITVPFPAPGVELGTLDIAVDGDRAGDVEIPPLEQARRRAFQWQTPRAYPGHVFAGTEFPRMDFENPLWIEHLVGTYSVSATYYDAGYNEVESAEKPGRYGAVVEITPSVGEPAKRYVTLFRQADHVQWWEHKWETFSNTLPDGMGIDPEVVRKQQKTLADHLKWSMTTSLYEKQGGAILMAGLYETSPQDPPAVDRTSARSRNGDWWIGLKHKLGLLDTRYLLYLPQDYHKDKTTRWPLMLFLHGRGERGSNVEDVKRHGPPKRIAAGQHYPFIVVSPQCPDADGSWQPKRLGLLLDKIAAEYRVDLDRVYCTGLSMGGYGTWRMAQAYPDRFAALAPICGGGDPRDVARIKDIPTWVFHGAKDDAVPLKCSRDMVNALKKQGAKPRFTIYPDAYHNSWTETYNNPELYEWLLKQEKK